ncbi:MAG: DUF2281 domain-containing protein [Microcystis panniformis]
MSASNQNPKQNFFQKLAVIAKEPPAIIGAISLLAGSFFGGMQFMQLQLQPQIDLLKTKKEEQATEIERFKGCEGSITNLTDNQKVKGNTPIKGKISLCQEKRKWLVVSPITTTNKKGEKAATVEEIIIPKNNQPMVKLVSTKTSPKHPPLFGSDKNIISISDDFDEPLEDFKDYI